MTSRGLIKLLVWAVQVPFVLADSDDLADFSNNLAQDIGPLLALFGDSMTKQFLSESTTFLDYFIFAMCPIGIITAIVSAIRVCGHSSLRAFIGRSQESDAIAESELCTSVSQDVCELFNKNRVTRALGSAQVLELVLIWKKKIFNGVELEEPHIMTFQHYLRQVDEKERDSEWEKGRRTAFGRRAGCKTEIRADLKPSRPNLSLNVGIIRQPDSKILAIACFGLVLQSGVLAMAAVEEWLLDRHLAAPASTSQAYAPGMFIGGTILMCFGMWSCAAIIGQCTTEVYYSRRRMTSNEHTQLIWVQPGRQVIGEQNFEPYIYFENQTHPLRHWVTSARQRHSEKKFEILTFGAVIATIAGYVLQFVGLRGMKATVSIAQLLVTVCMSFLRGTLRIQRLGSSDNQLKKDSARAFTMELDWLAFKGRDDDRRNLRWHWCATGQVVPAKEVHPAEQASTFCASSPSLMPTPPSPNSLGEPATSLRCQKICLNIFSLRCQLASLTGNPGHRVTASFLQNCQAWESKLVAIRERARQLSIALGEAADVILGHGQTAAVQAGLDVAACSENEKHHSFSRHRTTIPVNLSLCKQPIEAWMCNSAQIEAILGLWVYSSRADERIQVSDNKAKFATVRILSAGLDDDVLDGDTEMETELRLWANSKDIKVKTLQLSVPRYSTPHPASIWQHSAKLFLWVHYPPRMCQNGPEEFRSEQLACQLLNWQILEKFIRSALPNWRQDRDAGLRKVIKAQVASVDGTVAKKYAQQIFISVVESLTQLPGFEIPRSTITGQNGHVKLRNALVDKLARVFVDNGLGSHSDAIICIVAQLRNHLLPRDIDLFSSVTNSAVVCRQHGAWKRAEAILRWGCSKLLPETNSEADAREQRCRNALLRSALISTGELYRISLSHTSDNDRMAFGRQGIEWMERSFGPTANTRFAFEDVAKCEIQDVVKRYAEVERMLSTSTPPAAPPESELHPLVSSLQEKGRTGTLYHLCFMQANDLYLKELQPAFPLATRNGWWEVVEDLLEKHVDVNSADTNGRTALSYAAELSNIHKVEGLIQDGAIVNQPDNEMRTPLHWAAWIGQPDVVELLLQHGADPEKRDGDDATPLQYATTRGNAGVKRILSEMRVKSRPLARHRRSRQNLRTSFTF